MNKEKIIDDLKNISLVLNFNIPNLNRCWNILERLLLDSSSLLPQNEKEGLKELLDLMYENLDELFDIIYDKEYTDEFYEIIEILKSLDKTEVNKIGN